MNICRFVLASIYAAALLFTATAAAADSDNIDTYHCENCYESCGSWFFDFQCNLDKAFCLSTVSLVGGILQAGAASCEIEHNENYSEADSLVLAANDLLVENNLFTKEFVDSVNVYFCKLPPDGLAPTDNVVLIKSEFHTAPLLELTKLLAREYYHTYQHREIGTDNLYCLYIENSILSFSGNPIEKEADDFETDAGKCLFDNEGCPDVPLI